MTKILSSIPLLTLPLLPFPPLFPLLTLPPPLLRPSPPLFPLPILPLSLQPEFFLHPMRIRVLLYP